MDIIRNLYLHKYSHKMFYKTKSSSPSARRSNSATAATVTTSQQSNNADGLRSQQFYIYAIDRAPGANTINMSSPPNLDLPPSYEDAVKDPKYVRREVV